MFRFFRRIFKPIPLPAMLDYLETHADVTGIFSLTERGQPIGEKHEVWLLWKDASRCLAGTVTTGAYPQEMNSVAVNIQEIDHLLERHGFWQMRDELGNTRDGIHRAFGYAGRDRSRIVRIWNPQPGSSHADFVDDVVNCFKRCGVWQ